MLKYLIVLLDENAVSFCNYITNETKSSLVSIKKLKSIIDYSLKENLSISFLYGNNKLSSEYEDIINKVVHVKFVPISLIECYSNCIGIINEEDINDIDKIKTNENILILRLKKDNLKKLPEIFKKLIGKFKRLNLSLIDINNYKENDLKFYKDQIENISSILASEYLKGNSLEVNFLSDRILLNHMNNCNAGIDHITVSPDGHFYLCPGFYYDNKNNFIGNINDGFEIKNKQLLSIDHAPICSHCDAFHCKRCVYLNKKLTLEINTPSRQQCVLSHYEREASRNLLNTLKQISPFNKIQPIPEVDYIDPFELLSREMMNEQKEKVSTNRINSKSNNTSFDGNSIKIILTEILDTQKEILKKLNKLGEKQL